MVAEMHAKIARGELERVPWGRKPGGRNRAKAVIEAEKRTREERRALRRVEHQARADRRARREAERPQREELAEYEHRRQAANRGIPFWSDAAAPPPKLAPRDRPHSHAHNPSPDPATAAIPASFPPGGQDEAGIPDALLDEVVTLVAQHGARKADIKVAIAALERLEKAYTKRLADWQRPLPYDHAAQLYRRIRQYEQTFGRSDGKEARLAKLAQAFVDYGKKWAVRQTLAVIAGRDRRVEARASWPCEEGPHSIAPWLRR
jgi:hypothetical protein